MSAEDKDDQDVVVETCRCMQVLVEHWIQQNQREVAKEKVEEESTFINDVTDCDQWMSEPKLIGSRVIRVEIFFTIKTNAAFRELIQGQN